MLKRSDVAQGIWDLITAAYGQRATTQVAVPAEEVMEILLSVAANVLAQLPTADREMVQRNMGPKLDRLINSVRSRPSLHVHYSPKPGILLPH